MRLNRNWLTIMVCVMALILLGLVLYGIMEILERRIVFWRRGRFTG